METKDKALAKPKEPQELIAKIALTGNLAPLSEEQRWDYYQAYCRYLGLDPITRPFDILTRTEKDGSKIVTLYANASCSSQIADLRGVNYGRPEIEFNDGVGILTVWVKASLPSGRERWGDGVVHIQALGGKTLENALKKATTQAHRRATLALCGISMPDESEIEDILTAQTARIAAPSTDPQWVDPAEIREILEPAREKLAEVKAAQSDGTLRIQKEPEPEQLTYTAENRAHSKEIGERLDRAARKLVDFGATADDLRNTINSTVKREEDQIVGSRFELTDQEARFVITVFEEEGKKLEAKSKKKAKA